MSLIPTEHIGSIPRPRELIAAYQKQQAGEISEEELEALATQASIDTIKKMEETGSYCVGDGEQRKFSGFASYCLHGAHNFAPDGAEILFSDGHSRVLPRLTKGPFKYQITADMFLEDAMKHTGLPVKQAVIAPSLLSLLYPNTPIPEYSRNRFLQDIIRQHHQELARCLELGAHKVQIDFTEGRLSLKLDPSGELLTGMIDLINTGLENFTDAQRRKIGLHTCPGADRDATHSADVDYKDLLPTLFRANVGNFYVAMASEKDPEKVLLQIKSLIKPDVRVFIGVIDPIDPVVETPEQVCERVLKAAEYIPLDNLGTTDDCGFSPFADDDSTSRDIAFAKIKARVEGTRMAEEILIARK
ncbi:cobalamin-independent methionine synthase II family protein [Gynuella sunshinyii]|uniref:Methionine synthase II (Cobalamin-independent) n=1 Tax=Gynuella sunshinyii YC6258 TaxID=1445510 RepID=A0A0C5VND8_9GAMM|nr:cobalamin-independent methionine synthase II family protein [Gynuella sunshinyii]AJQ94898.1 methionine synthase II (cobalamin-independent) [Gynuella sunshinyii YC6258]